ncbi:MAG: biotin--[acetyl-CoA-carboxylase] ligase [Clostridiales bacterium]|nr:biotin--[acetyl-CoA-carboxylase] ligase [Clostridiales bacterium]
MDTSNEIIKRLLCGEASGTQLAGTLGITRAAVHKHVKSLAKYGFIIEATPSKGYKLRNTDVLHRVVVEHYLQTQWKIETVEETTSTNADAKRHAAAGELRYTVLADRQSAGRGRLGRSFFSPPGAGMYLSAVIKPREQNAAKITAYAAVAAARAVEELCGARVDVKWVNDLYMNGKKICGILTEGSVGLEGGALEYAVVGIGINCKRVDLPSELKDKVTSVEAESGVQINRVVLAAKILDALTLLETDLPDFMDEYRARNIVCGKTVTVNGEYEAKAVAILDNGALVLERDGKQTVFAAGEVSIKV